MVKHVKSSITIKTNREAKQLQSVVPFYDIMERDGINSPQHEI